MRLSKSFFAASFFLTLLAAPLARAQDAPPSRNFDAGGRVRFGASLVGMQSPGRSVFEPMAGAGIELRYQTTTSQSSPTRAPREPRMGSPIAKRG